MGKRQRERIRKTEKGRKIDKETEIGGERERKKRGTDSQKKMLFSQQLMFLSKQEEVRRTN
jgi:hypothetical protein